ncbi:Contactin associated protein 1-like protein [Daphnia magna]|uniref:Contactin associated protein 1-like protein n=1 Tax=Daphnia magna TaxID=35525 RepID=A0A0P5Y4B8_9CRUS|nr:Contactin associated protein 1-like protein [Daphnia magna]
MALMALLVVVCLTFCSTASAITLQDLNKNFVKFKEAVTAKEIKLEAKVTELETKLLRLEGLVERNLISLIKEDFATKMVQLENNVSQQKEMLIALQTKEPADRTTFELDNSENAYFFAKRSILRTCQEIRAAIPSLSSGMYWIDPDGQGVGDDPIYVYCNMTTGSSSVTHDSESPINVGHCAEPGCYSRTINYNATSKQMIALAELSGKCQQSITYDCTYAPFEFNNVPFGWWSDRHGNPQYFWAGSNASAHTCQCSIDQSCVDATAKCNCDSTSPMQLTDQGFVTDKKVLPVTRLSFGRTQFEISSGVHTLGRFECFGQAKSAGIPTSCEDLWRIGHSLNGLYSIKGPAMMEIIFCDFTKLPGDAGFQRWVGYADVKSTHVYFYVQRSQRFTTVNASIPFDVATLNVGNGMNVTTGIFTAPRAGTYFFCFTGLAEFPTFPYLSYLGIDLYWNGNLTGRAFVEDVNTVAGQYSPLSLQSTLHMQQGDQVWLQIDTLFPLVGGRPAGRQKRMPPAKRVVLFDDSRHFTHFTGWMLEEEISRSL